MYPFKKMKHNNLDSPEVVKQKVIMRDKYEKFIKKLNSEKSFYISDYG